MQQRRAAIGAMVGGLLVSAAALRLLPRPALPLYDGVIVIEPYRWLQGPTCEPSHPTSASATEPVTGSSNPSIIVATSEQPPQAQFFMASGVLALRPGTSSIEVRIDPIAPPVPPPAGSQIAGNVYRIAVTDQLGRPIVAPAAANATVVLRAPDGFDNVTLERIQGDTWRALQTESAGLASTYQALVTDLGAFALLAPASQTIPCPGAFSPASLLGPLIILVLLLPLALLVFLLLRRPQPAPGSEGKGRR